MDHKIDKNSFQPPQQMAEGSPIYYGDCYNSGSCRRSRWRQGQLLFKKSQLFGMNLDGDEIYTKIVIFDDIYNFVVQTFFHLKSFSESENRYTV
jgi:hypothetical protein